MENIFLRVNWWILPLTMLLGTLIGFADYLRSERRKSGPIGKILRLSCQGKIPMFSKRIPLAALITCAWLICFASLPYLCPLVVPALVASFAFGYLQFSMFMFTVMLALNSESID